MVRTWVSNKHKINSKIKIIMQKFMVEILPSNLVGLSVIHYVENVIIKSAPYHSWGIDPQHNPK